MPTGRLNGKKEIMHGKISIDGEVLMASDAPPATSSAAGLSVSLTVTDPATANANSRPWRRWRGEYAL